MTNAIRRGAAAGLAAIVFASAGCSDSPKPSTPQFSQEEMMKQAEQQRQTHEKLRQRQ